MKHYGIFADFPSLRAFLETTLRNHLNSFSTRSEKSRHYRFEHCQRVAQIGKEVALAANIDAELLELACLLHDYGKWDAVIAVDHGRKGAMLLQEILQNLSLDPLDINEICQGIAMHVDGSCNPTPESGEPLPHYANSPSLLAICVGQCDNIDRYSAYRLYNNLQYVKFSKLSATERQIFISNYLNQLANLAQENYATALLNTLWQRNLALHRTYFTQLAAELQANI